MILPIAQALPGNLLEQCLTLGSDDGLFSDGRHTAGWYARDRKHNLQARPDKRTEKLLSQIQASLLENELLQAAARPKAIIRLLLSRYDEGMHYGAHVDDALMSAQRTDLSFTVFLTPPEDYEGGALVIDEPAAERSFRQESGSLLLYPANTLHRVDPVTRGRRLVLVGWIRSLIRDPGQREILFDLDRSIAALRASENQEETLALLLKTRSNLLRRWADD